MIGELDKRGLDDHGGSAARGPGPPGDQEVPHDGFPCSIEGIEDNPPPYFNAQKTVAQEYKKMERQMKLQKAEYDILQDQLNCRINCLKVADEEVSLATRQFKRIAEEYSSSFDIVTSSNGHPLAEENHEDPQSNVECDNGEDSTEYNEAIENYNGPLLENIMRHHFKERLRKISTILGDTIKKASDRITTLQAELRRSQEIASQVVTIWMASRQSPQNDIEPVTQSPPPQSSPEAGNGVGDKGHQSQLLPPSPSKFHSTDSSDIIEDNDCEVISNSDDKHRTPHPFLFNILVQNHNLGPPIPVPAYLSSSASPPNPTLPNFHAWEILNRPLPTNFFKCCCQFKCLTFLGLLNHFRKLNQPVASGRRKSPPRGSSPPLLINLEEEADEYRRSPPCSPPPPSHVIPSITLPSSSPPTLCSSPLPSPVISSIPLPSSSLPPPQCSPSSVIVESSPSIGITTGVQDCRSTKKKTYISDYSKVPFRCTAMTPLPNGKLCTRRFVSLVNLRKHQLKFHSSEDVVYDLTRKGKTDVERGPCTLCEKVGTKSDKCELMHKPARKRKWKDPVVDMVDIFLEKIKKKKMARKKGGELETKQYNRELEAETGASGAGDMPNGMVKRNWESEAACISFDGD